MRPRFHLLSLLLILLFVACGGGEDIDYEALAQSVEDAINSRDADTLMSLWSEDGGWIELYFDPTDTSDVIRCDGLSRDCWQEIFDRGETWRFSEYRPGLPGSICFKLEFSKDGASWTNTKKGGGEVYLRFEVEKINGFSWGCPG